VLQESSLAISSTHPTRAIVERVFRVDHNAIKQCCFLMLSCSLMYAPLFYHYVVLVSLYYTLDTKADVHHGGRYQKIGKHL
jgi:hypothetical protein